MLLTDQTKPVLLSWLLYIILQKELPNQRGTQLLNLHRELLIIAASERAFHSTAADTLLQQPHNTRTIFSQMRFNLKKTFNNLQEKKNPLG